MSSNMKKVKLGEVANIDVSNIDKKTKENEDSVFLCNFVDVYKNWAITKEMCPSFMKATANKNQISRFSLFKGQVAITKDSETREDIGIPTYIADDLPNTVLGYHCILLTPNQELLYGKYLNLLLHSQYAQNYFEKNASGSGQRYTLTNDIVFDFPVWLHNLDIQKRISKIFTAIDCKLKLNTKIINEQEAMAKLIYNYWFVQFDFPDENNRPLFSRIFAQINNPFRLAVQYA